MLTWYELVATRRCRRCRRSRSRRRRRSRACPVRVIGAPPTSVTIPASARRGAGPVGLAGLDRARAAGRRGAAPGTPSSRGRRRRASTCRPRSAHEALRQAWGPMAGAERVGVALVDLAVAVVVLAVADLGHRRRGGAALPRARSLPSQVSMPEQVADGVGDVQAWTTRRAVVARARAAARARTIWAGTGGGPRPGVPARPPAPAYACARHPASRRSSRCQPLLRRRPRPRRVPRRPGPGPCSVGRHVHAGEAVGADAIDVQSRAQNVSPSGAVRQASVGSLQSASGVCTCGTAGRGPGCRRAIAVDHRAVRAVGAVAAGRARCSTSRCRRACSMPAAQSLVALARRCRPAADPARRCRRPRPRARRRRALALGRLRCRRADAPASWLPFAHAANERGNEAARRARAQPTHRRSVLIRMKPP